MADWPPFLKNLPATADFVYVRRHGSGGDYTACYGTAELKEDARIIGKYLIQKKDVFIYFNNDAGGCAPKNATELGEILHGH